MPDRRKTNGLCVGRRQSDGGLPDVSAGFGIEKFIGISAVLPAMRAFVYQKDGEKSPSPVQSAKRSLSERHKAAGNTNSNKSADGKIRVSSALFCFIIKMGIWHVK